MRNSKYWDDFQRRIHETTDAIRCGDTPPVRRVACFVTNRCNFRCKYCNHATDKQIMTQETFERILDKYGDTAIMHITGGEPSTVPWLYEFIKQNSERYRFHLNTNAYIKPPSEHVKRLKISLDSCDEDKWNHLVGRSDAFNKVVKNIKNAIPHTVVSLTYTLSKQSYKDVIRFAEFCRENFPGLYAIFFSVYKGKDANFAFDNADIDYFFDDLYFRLLDVLDDESKALIQETINEKRRLMQGVRFKQNCSNDVCYLSMSERVFSPEGEEFTCSHLYRDKIGMLSPKKHEKCKYGCNMRLVDFNRSVAQLVRASG